MLYALVNNGAIERVNITLPYTVGDTAIPAGATGLEQFGLLPILGDEPAYDPATQRMAGPAYQLDGAVVRRVYTVEQIPAEEIRAARTAAIAARRYEREIAGILWRGYGIATDRESQAKIDTEERAADKGLRVDGKGWKCVDLSTGTVTFRPTTNAEMQEIATAAYGYVSACFAREEALLFALDAGDYSDSMLATGWPSQQVG